VINLLHFASLEYSTVNQHSKMHSMESVCFLLWHQIVFTA